MDIDDLVAELEVTTQLGRPALTVNRVLRFLYGGVTLLSLPIAIPFAFVHGAFMLVTLGLYSLLWALLWLPMLGVTLLMSWLWQKAPWFWPIWLLLALPFLLAGYMVVLVGPRDRDGADASMKLGLLDVWPYSLTVIWNDPPTHAVIPAPLRPGNGGQHWWIVAAVGAALALLLAAGTGLLIGLIARGDQNGVTSQQREAYPESVIETFVDSCINGGGTQAQCDCAIEAIQEIYTLGEFTEIALDLAEGGDIPPGLLGPIVSCTDA